MISAKFDQRRKASEGVWQFAGVNGSRQLVRRKLQRAAEEIMRDRRKLCRSRKKGQARRGGRNAANTRQCRQRNWLLHRLHDATSSPRHLTLKILYLSLSPPKSWPSEALCESIGNHTVVAAHFGSTFPKSGCFAVADSCKTQFGLKSDLSQPQHRRLIDKLIYSMLSPSCVAA